MGTFLKWFDTLRSNALTLHRPGDTLMCLSVKRWLLPFGDLDGKRRGKFHLAALDAPCARREWFGPPESPERRNPA